MAVNYSVFQQKFDVTRKGELKYYARAQSSGELKFNKLCKRISDKCTATKADVKVVLEGLIMEIQDSLADSNIVRLGDLGSFQISLSSEGVMNENEITPSSITGAKIIFRPGEELKYMLDHLEYKKVRTKRSRSSDKEKV